MTGQYRDGNTRDDERPLAVVGEGHYSSSVYVCPAGVNVRNVLASAGGVQN